MRQYIAGFTEAGCDELIICPSASDPAQVDLLAEGEPGAGTPGDGQGAERGAATRGRLT